MTTRIPVSVEETPRRSFATAIDWPGWSRSGKTVAAALETLGAYADRYRAVATAAGEPFPADEVEIEVYETHPGDGGTAFGVPMRVSEADRRPTSAADGERLARLVVASWALLDEIVAGAPEALRKGPRGGGRDTSKIVDHTLGADHGYAQAMGLGGAAPTVGDRASIEALRAAMLDLIGRPSDGSTLKSRWTVRYAAHRIAWHSLDHGWEIRTAGAGEPALAIQPDLKRREGPKRRRRPPGLEQLADPGRAVGLRELSAVRPSDERMVEEPRRHGPSEQPAEAHLRGRRLDEVLAPDHEIDPVAEIVDDHAHGVGPVAVPIADREVACRGHRPESATEHGIGPRLLARPRATRQVMPAASRLRLRRAQPPGQAGPAQPCPWSAAQAAKVVLVQSQA